MELEKTWIHTGSGAVLFLNPRTMSSACLRCTDVTLLLLLSVDGRHRRRNCYPVTTVVNFVVSIKHLSRGGGTGPVDLMGTGW